MANLKTIQFLRNANAYASLDEAKAALTTQAANCLDGSPLIGRYTVGTEERTVLGIVHVSGSTTGVTFFNNEKEIDNVLQGLDYGPIGGTDSSVLTQIQQVDGKISGLTSNVGSLVLSGYTKGSDSGTVASTDTINAALAKLENKIDAVNGAIDALDYNLAADDNKVVVSLNQTDGAVSGTSVNISGIKLAGYAEAAATGDVATTDTLGEALGKLQKTIHEMDKAADAENGKVVTTVSEADGVVSETKENVKNLQLGGYAKTSDTGDIASADTINVALSKLENKANAITIGNADGSINVTTAATGTDINVNINTDEHVLAKDGNAGLYTNIALSSITPSSTIVKEEYQLTATDGSKLGDSIKIYKDSHIVSITYITDSGDTHYQNLEYVYLDVSGETKTEYVDMSELVLEAEFASGVTADASGVVHGVVDPASESFLTVGADGFKVAGVSAFVQSEIEKLDASVSGGSATGTATTGHVQVVIDEVNGKLTAVTVSEANIADASDIAELSAKTFTVATSSNSSISAVTTAATDGTVSVDLTTDASKVKMTGFTADGSGFTAITTASTVTEAVKAIETAFIENEEVVSSSLNDLNTRLNTVSGDVDTLETDLATLSGKTVTGVDMTGGAATITDNTDGTKKITISTDGSQILATGFDATATSGTPASGDSVSEVLSKLYANSKMDAVKAGSATTVTPASDGTTVDVKLDTTSAKSTFNGDNISGDNGTNALTITNDGLFLSRDWDCGTF